MSCNCRASSILDQIIHTVLLKWNGCQHGNHSYFLHFVFIFEIVSSNIKNYYWTLCITLCYTRPNSYSQVVNVIEKNHQCRFWTLCVNPQNCILDYLKLPLWSISGVWFSGPINLLKWVRKTCLINSIDLDDNDVRQPRTCNLLSPEKQERGR